MMGRCLSLSLLIAAAAVAAVALPGDAQIAQALNWVHMGLPVDKLMLRFYNYTPVAFIQQYHDCPRNQSFFALPAIPEGTFLKVLQSGYLRIGTMKHNAFLQMVWELGLAALGRQYPAIVTPPSVLLPSYFFFETPDDLFTALNNGTIDCTDMNSGIAGSALGVRKTMGWQPACACYCAPLRLSSRPELQIKTVNDLRVVVDNRKLQGFPSEIAVSTYTDGLLMMQLFDVHTSVYSEAELEQLMRQTTQPASLLAASSPSLWVADYLENYNANGATPTTTFVRRDDNQTKVMTAQAWETGNEKLAQTFEAAMMELSSSGYRDQLFRSWNMNPDLAIDCLSSHASFPIPDADGKS
eukprot:TRINITY_DN3_c2_g1_i8.p1 TRINITY_DN3_c2_g1~~TRINITY_DN3_c2_g1_i8.p1  ORF type:complete len:354 (-),score=38.85 TRINITY_DN3_c2_g1_i8:170-1231(-)